MVFQEPNKKIIHKKSNFEVFKVTQSSPFDHQVILGDFQIKLPSNIGGAGEHISYSEIELSKEDLSEKPRKGRKKKNKPISEIKLPIKKSISQDCKYAECNEFITK